MSPQANLHIAHIVDLRVIGGIERMALELILATPQVRHSLVLFDKHIHPSLATPLAQAAQVVGIYSSKHWGSVRLPKSLRAGRRRQLIQQSGADVVLNWSQVLDTRGIVTPIVFYEHGSAWERYSTEQLQQCYHNIHHCIAVSQAAKRMLQLHHGVTQPITVIENTVFKQPNVNTQPRTLPTGRLVLGAAGRLVARKNFAVLIEAVAWLREQGRDVSLHIAGTGPDLERLQQRVQRLGLSEHVRLLGYVEDMDAFYQQCDVFVCPSIWESYGLVAIEAFAAGLPVIGAATDGLPEVVSDGINGVCIPPHWDGEAFTAAMHEAATFDRDYSYRALTDSMEAQQSLSPAGIATAVTVLMDDAERYHNMSRAALQAALAIKSYPQLAAAVLASVAEARA
ncbi:glycosyltransferase family 4 protein [Vitreoscilla massiliensis]|uniref:Glycosyltransferase family 4 protein n=1 Tax=Vitreoscilla massiliensis TaxID=1689272 RepID=A0ABY4DX11_9NEIS|nr:glycosyltransferase family 4 protein [Vitreoscilla massiliensis]UOO87809.1 glycosyltransferase family 4 protein [Vitreoscilla massiliensis]